MATPTLTLDGTALSTCEATTGWTANSLGLDAEFKKEGNNSLSGTIRGGSLSATYSTGGVDFSGYHCAIWFACTWAGVMQTKAANGVRIGLTDSTGNIAYWQMLGSDNYTGGWKLLIVDPSSTPDATTGGALDVANVSTFGLYFAQTSSPKNQDNTWWDHLLRTNGYTITGGDGTDQITWQNIADVDASSGYGIVQNLGGVYHVRGALQFGDSTANCYFKDTDKRVVFPNERVSSSLYKIKLVEGTGTTSFQMGDVSGSGDNSLGYDGCFVQAGEGQTWTFDAADDITTLKLYGCTFDGCDNIYLGDTTNDLGASGSTIHVVDNNFTGGSLLTRAIDGSATQLQLNNRVVGFDDTGGSVLIADDLGVDGARISVLNNNAFESKDDGTSETITVTDHDFAANDLFITVHNDKVWDVVNPVWSVDTYSQRNISFVGSDETTEKVNEKYDLSVTVTKTNGDPLVSEVYVLEALTNQDLPNHQTTDATTGQATDTILKATYYDQTGDPNNTYSLDLESSSSQYAYVDSTYGVDPSSAATFEAWIKPELLASWPAGGTSYLMSRATATKECFSFSIVDKNYRSVDFEADSTQYCSISDSNQTGLDFTGDFTLEAIMNLESLPGAGTGYTIIGKWGGVGARSYALAYVTGAGVGYFRLNLSSDTTADSTLQYSRSTLSTATWYHLAVVYRPSTGIASFYLDGTFDGTATGGPSSIGNGTGAFGVSSVSPSSFDGKIDEVRVWDVARTADEINDNQTACTFNGHEANLQGLWQFENDYVDEGPNNNDMTATNSPTFSTTVSASERRVLRLELSEDSTNVDRYDSRYVSLSDTGWQHVAVTWSGGTAKFYLDRELDSTFTRSDATGNIYDSTGLRFEVGAKDGTDFYDGKIDEVRVWSNVKEAVELGTGVGVGSLGRWLFNNDYTDDSVYENNLTSSGSPTFSTDVRTNPTLASDVYGDFALKVYTWGYEPAVLPLTVDQAINLTVALPVDNALDATSAAQAISDGTAITVTHNNDTILLAYKLGVSSFNIGDVVTGASSGADGTVNEVIETDSTSGRILLTNWDGTNFTHLENLQVSAVTKAQASINFDAGNPYGQWKYAWAIDAANNSMQVVYDYLMAKLADSTLDAIFEDVVEWGRSQYAKILFSGVSGYSTNRSNDAAEGGWVYNRGSGLIEKFTADAGNFFTPPVSVTFTLTGLDASSEVRIYDSTSDSELAGTENSDGTFDYIYTYSSDVSAYVRIHHLDNIWQSINVTLGNQDQSVPVQNIIDRNYENP